MMGVISSASQWLNGAVLSPALYLKKNFLRYSTQPFSAHTIQPLVIDDCTLKLRFGCFLRYG